MNKTVRKSWNGIATLVMAFLMPVGVSSAVQELEDSTATNEVRLSEVVVIGQNKVLKKNEVASVMVVVGGNAKVDGKVENDLVVVGGSAEVNGSVGGDMVAVLSSSKIGPDAHIRGDAISVLGQWEADPKAKIDGVRQEIPFPDIPGMRWLKDWLTKGLFLLRPLPPRSIGIWGIAGLFLMIYAFLCVLFPRPVQSCVTALETRPISSFVLGVVALLLAGPLFLLLLVTIIGAPFLLCALTAALLFGKAAVFRHVGQQLGRQLNLSFFQVPLVGLVLGALIFFLLYTIPVLGFLVWGIITPMGLGAVIWACLGRFRREGDQPQMASGGTNPGVASLAVPLETPLTPPLEAASLPKAGFWIRLWTTLLDLILIFFVTLPFHVFGISLFAWIAYLVALWTWKGTTIGGIVFGLKLVRLDGRPLNFTTAFVRGLAGFFSAIPLGLGFFWAGWDRDKQSWHDKIAGTTIVRLPKGVSLI